MPRVDNFIPFSAPSSNEFTILDAWVPLGGEWLFLEFGRFTGSSDIRSWVINGNPNVVSDSGIPITAVTMACGYDSRHGEMDVIAKCKLSRVLAKDEVLTLNESSVSILRDDSGNKAIIPTSITVRNYSNVDSSGGISFGTRSGASPNAVKQDPNTDATTLANKIFTLRAEDANSSDINTGLWSGGVAGNDLTTKRGSMTYVSSDPNLNNNPSITLSQNFIGKLGSYFPKPQDGITFTYIAVIRPLSNGSYFNLSHTRETETGVGVPPGGEGIVALATGVDVTSFTVRDFWTIDDEVVSRSFLNIDSSNEVSAYRGNPRGRHSIVGVEWDGTTRTARFFTFAGHELKAQTVSSADIETILQTNDDTGYEYFGVNITNEPCSVAEIYGFNTIISDVKKREWIAFLDDKYKTTSKQIHIDPLSGSDGNTGSSTSPYKTYAKAVTDVLYCAGDSILYATGTSESITGSTIGIEIGSTYSDATWGYSPDFPFVLGYYGDRNLARPIHTFDNATERFVNIKCKPALTAIVGNKFNCDERNPESTSYIGISGVINSVGMSNGLGTGITLDSNLGIIPSPDSIQVFDCDISNTLRHGISLRTFSSDTVTIFPNQLKYNGIIKTSIHNIHNPKNYINCNHEPGFGSTHGFYGVAGIYSEGLGGLLVERCSFFRCGWSPELDIISFGDVTYTSEVTFTTTGIASTLDGLISSWDSSMDADKDYQRIRITDINGVATSGKYLKVSSWSGDVLTTKENGSSVGLVGGETVNFTLTDGSPRNGGNGDIVINHIPTNSLVNPFVHHGSFGPYVFNKNIHVESSGHAVISDANYLFCNNIIESNMFGVILSSRYTTISNNFFGGTVGTDITRKVPSGEILTDATIGSYDIKTYANDHGWMIAYPPLVGVFVPIIKYNIFAFAGITGFGGSPSYSYTNNIFPTAAIFIGTLNDFVANSGNIHHNTFFGLPGNSIIISELGVVGEITLFRNLYDMNTDYPPIGIPESVYNFAFPFGTEFQNIHTGQYGPYNIYNQSNASTSTGSMVRLEIDDGNAANNPTGQFTLTYDEWINETGESESSWTDISYATSARSLATYNGVSFGGDVSSWKFASNAIAEHQSQGWSQAYGADYAMQYITQGFSPSNLVIDDYGYDIVGAVEFSSTGAGITFGSYYIQEQIYHGFGRGF